MRFPEKNSRGEKILRAFFKRGPMTIYQGAEEHGEFKTLRVPQGIEHEEMVVLYVKLVERGCLEREGILYRLTVHARQRMENLASTDAPRSIVPPRIRNFLNKPLFAGYSPFNPWRISL